ncbi:Mannose-6-phosphate isomerase, partial [Cladochytrium tenue]
MGTHVSGASELHGSSSGGAQLLLSELLRGAPALAGAGGGGAGPVTSAAATAGELPFLFKVLSIRKALSIQAHPDKALAARLHAERPGVYKDGNHKPEMALALTPFEALIGFRPLREIHAHLTRFPELAAVVGSETTQKLADAAGSAGDNTPAGRAALQALFGALMGADEAAMRAQLATLVGRLRAQASSPVGTLEELVVRLDSQFPADVGTFCALLLNYVKMEPGQAVFLAANEPHAYLSGDCVECMATSDNVVRSGLTPKYKDVATLVSMLTYRSGTASSQLLSGEPFGAAPHTTL